MNSDISVSDFVLFFSTHSFPLYLSPYSVTPNVTPTIILAYLLPFVH